MYRLDYVDIARRSSARGLQSEYWRKWRFSTFVRENISQTVSRPNTARTTINHQLGNRISLICCWFLTSARLSCYHTPNSALSSLFHSFILFYRPNIVVSCTSDDYVPDVFWGGKEKSLPPHFLPTGGPGAPNFYALWSSGALLKFQIWRRKMGSRGWVRQKMTSECIFNSEAYTAADRCREVRECVVRCVPSCITSGYVVLPGLVNDCRKSTTAWSSRHANLQAYT